MSKSSQESSPITQYQQKIQTTLNDYGLISIDPHIMGGEPVITGTRVLVETILTGITSATIELIAGLKVYVCRNCGYHPANRANWCNKGCGNDYNQMHEVDLRQSLKELKSE